MGTCKVKGFVVVNGFGAYYTGSKVCPFMFNSRFRKVWPLYSDAARWLENNHFRLTLKIEAL
jgi:hypothetical protein